MKIIRPWSVGGESESGRALKINSGGCEDYPALVWRRKSGEEKTGEEERRLFERSEFLRFRRDSLRSRLQTEAGGFSFCLLFLFDAKKKK